MADKNKRAANGGQGKAAPPATGPSGARVASFSANLQGLHGQLQELVKNTGGIKEYDALLGAHESLREEFQESQLKISQLRKEAEESKKLHEAETLELQEEIDQLEAYSSRLNDNYGRKYEEWSSNSKSQEVTLKELAEVRVKLEKSQRAAATTQSEIDCLRRDRDGQDEDLRDALEHCASYERERDMLRLQVEDLKQKAGKATAERQDAVNQLGFLPLNTERVNRDFSSLADRVRKLAGVVASELPDPGVIIELPAKFPIRVPSSNSRAARYMRRAVAETLIANELRDSVFVDFYGEHLNLDGVRQALSFLEANRCQRESDIIRCQLVRALGSWAPDTSQKAKRMALGVKNTLAPWIPDDSKRDEFEDDLVGVFKTALALWRPIQQAERWVDAVFDLDLQYWDAGVGRREDFDGAAFDEAAPGNQAHRSGSEMPMIFGPPIAVLFPHLYTADGKIFSGSALFQSQLMVVEAFRELQSQQAFSGGRVPPRRRSSTRDPPSPRNRRVSTSSGDGTRLKLGSVGMASDASTSQRRSPVGPDTAASASSTRSQRSGATANGR